MLAPLLGYQSAIGILQLNTVLAPGLGLAASVHERYPGLQCGGHLAPQGHQVKIVNCKLRFSHVCWDCRQCFAALCAISSG